MTLAGDLLLQIRVDKGYGHSRVAFVAFFGIRWGEHTQRFLEAGRTLMREDVHLKHLVEIGLVKRDNSLFRQFQSAIVHDQKHKYQTMKLHVEHRQSMPTLICRRSGDETEEEMKIREIFEALQIEGFFDPWGPELFSEKRSSAPTGADITHSRPGLQRTKRKLADTAITVSASRPSHIADASTEPLPRTPSVELQK